MENQKTIDALRAFREQLAADLISGAQPYEIASRAEGNYVTITATIDGFTAKFGCHVNGWICYHTDFTHELFGDKDIERAFVERVWREYHANEKTNAMKRKGELQKELAKLDKIIGEETA